MRISIKYKLFFNTVLTTFIAVAGMYFFMQWSFHRGFLNYADSQELQNTTSLSDRLLELYIRNGGWDALRDNATLWRSIQSEVRPNRGTTSTSQERPAVAMQPAVTTDPLRVGPRTLLLDADKHHIVGGNNRVKDISSQKMSMVPIEYEGDTVGYIALLPLEELTDTTDILYVEKQTRIFGLIALAALLVAVLLSIPLIHHLLVPVKALIRGANKLTAGDYTVRIPATTGDELARLSEHFNLLATTLERNEKSRRQYMADVSHDLRTPLAILLGEIEAIQDGVRDMEKTLPVLHGEVTHLNRLVGDLYELSLSDIGALSYRKHTIDPVVALEQALEQYTPRMAARDIRLSSRLPEEGTLALSADPSRLQQLFTNLLENSLRYTDAGGRVEAAMHREDRKLSIIIRDSAPGVPDASLSKLFARFYRVETSRNRERGGSGLGLAICWNIVEAHEGNMEARPSALGGLEIEVTLPLV
jgi:two-component system sensor histidine kinase BaeS